MFMIIISLEHSIHLTYIFIKPKEDERIDPNGSRTSSEGLSSAETPNPPGAP